MTDVFSTFIAGFAPVALDELDRCAPLLTRRDRKYLLAADDLIGVLESVPGPVCVLADGDRHRFSYTSTYFDTAGFDVYRLAATKRPRRFKVRSRRYVDAAVTMAEVKTKDRAGRTVKHRRPVDERERSVDDSVLAFASDFSDVAPYVDELEPRLTTRYRRVTLALPDVPARCTIDTAFEAIDRTGARTGLAELVVFETKTDGPPSPVDRLLWRAGHRPVRFSKYSTALAALHPELPANRWHRVLVRHFGRRRPGLDRVVPGERGLHAVRDHVFVNHGGTP